MIISKIKDFFKSFRNKVIVIIALVVVVSALLLSKYVLNKDGSTHDNDPLSITENTDDKVKSKKHSIEELRTILSPGIDSVLRNFGIKSEWVTNQGDDKNQKKGSKPPPKDAELFIKNVLIPSDLTSIEVNADISSYVSSLGLNSSVSEDIITKDIVLTVRNTDTAGGKLPLAKININHSDKVHRESSIICVIINNVTDYDPEDVDKLLMNKNEFSFVFPRNLDEINLQNKLLHGKKDVMINMTIGGHENYEADFNSSMDEKAIHERVKSFSVDFPTVTTVLLTKKDSDIPPQLVKAISEDFKSYKIRVIGEGDLAQLLSKAEEESKEKYNVFTANLKNKGSLAKSIITTISVSKDDFGKFYDDILTLKKLGYKFYNYSDFASRKDEFEKQEQLKQDKAKEDKQKQDELKKKQNEKKKEDPRVPPQKNETKKKTDPKKKTETKKKTDVKKKK